MLVLLRTLSMYLFIVYHFVSIHLTLILLQKLPLYKRHLSSKHRKIQTFIPFPFPKTSHVLFRHPASSQNGTFY